MSDLFLPFASLALAGVVAILVIASHPRGLQAWWFFGGMVALGAVVALDALSLRANSYESYFRLHSGAMIARSLLAALWLAFSISYAREHRRSENRWRTLLSIVAILPIVVATWAVATASRMPVVESAEAAVISYGAGGHALNILLLIATVIILMNLEATFRASIGTTRWRVKFVALGLGIIFGAQIYTRSQALLFSSQPVNLAAVEASALFLGSILLVVAWFRGGFGEFQVYPSRASLAQSVTVFLVGGYLFVVGVLAQFISLLGDAANFQTQALLILIGIVCLGVLLLSDRLRLKVQHTFSRYFGRAFYDFRKVWTLSSERLSNQLNAESLCAAAARLISETFNTLSVRVWLLDDARQRLVLGASTAPSADEARAGEVPVTAEALGELHTSDAPFNLEKAQGPLAKTLRAASTIQFQHGGERLAVPLTSNARHLGLAVLADRVNGEPYTTEEADLLRCVAAQISATLLTLRVSGELVQAKELEAFQTMSAFFVHDLKNTVSTLNLMLQNLPVHFDNPEFRKDALRGIGNTVDRVNHLIARLSALRNKVELRPVETDLADLVQRTVSQLNGLAEVKLTCDLRPTPPVLVDPEHFGSVLSNLLLNARDAGSDGSAVEVEVAACGDRAIVRITDHGSGMTPEFIATSLFRPFSSTKNKGLGIGMFQCKFLVEAHRGTIEIESTVGVGTTVRVSLPVLPGTKR